MNRFALAAALAFAAVPAISGDWIAGYEGGSRHGYGYLTYSVPRSAGPGRQIIYWGTLSYLTYEVPRAGSQTDVRSPGLSGGAQYRFRSGDIDGGIGAGYEVRWTTRATPGFPDTDEVEHGPLVTADLGLQITDSTSTRISGGWSGANDWFGARGELLQKLSDSLKVGPEVGVQGNDEIKVYEYGGVAEVPLDRDRTWLRIRGGQSRIEYDSGIEETQPYFSALVVRRF